MIVDEQEAVGVSSLPCRAFRVRVGTDLVSNKEVAGSIDRFGRRYLERVYSMAELEQCRTFTGRPDPQRLAARFAGKEAAIKALGLIAHGSLRSIEVLNGPDGRPSLSLTGSAERRLVELGTISMDVSLTHEQGLASATVVLLTSDASITPTTT